MRRIIRFPAGFPALLLAILLVVLLFPLIMGEAFAHRFHTTLTRIDFNEKEKIAEITIQVFMHDLKLALERKSGKRLDLDREDEFSILAFEYLKDRFILKAKDGEAKDIRWIGAEKEVDSAWLYLEADFSGEPDGAFLQNSLFFDHFPEQSNIVILKFGEKKADLAFRVGDKFKEIKAKVSDGTK